MAICPNCGVGGPLSAPLMVHDPENQFLGVFVPPTGQSGDLQAQRVIGDLTQALMRKLPTDAREGVHAAGETLYGSAALPRNHVGIRRGYA